MTIQMKQSKAGKMRYIHLSTSQKSRKTSNVTGKNMLKMTILK